MPLVPVGQGGGIYFSDELPAGLIKTYYRAFFVIGEFIDL
jgi:hypothetical protein